LAAKLLSKNAVIAKEAARTLVKNLDTTSPPNRTSFENHLMTTQDLWDNLVEFANATLPVLLWQGHGNYEVLFKFIAPRFLLNPDHVLDAERIHSRWQWACILKRALKIQTLNASLRIMHYIENNQTFPTHQDLLPHLQAELLEHKLALDAQEAEHEIALGWRFCSVVVVVVVVVRSVGVGVGVSVGVGVGVGLV
jgi:hypothetical protein